jgi:hypothetical protein
MTKTDFIEITTNGRNVILNKESIVSITPIPNQIRREEYELSLKNGKTFPIDNYDSLKNFLLS